MKMNGKLVDTNVIIRFFKGESELFNLFDDITDIFVSTITVGELLYGANLSAKKDFNRELYKDFCEQLNVLDINMNTSEQYSLIKAILKKQGHPIPENDIWIAATALTNGLTLITADSDFEGIPGLKIEKR